MKTHKREVAALSSRIVELSEGLDRYRAANDQLKEQLIDSMQGEIQARRKLEQVRDLWAEQLALHSPTEERQAARE